MGKEFKLELKKKQNYNNMFYRYSYEHYKLWLEKHGEI